MQTWTGAEARLLRRVALRLSVREFASYLGVTPRTVSKWEAAGSGRQPRPHMQAILDTALDSADPNARARFERAVRGDGVEEFSGPDHDGTSNTSWVPVPVSGRTALVPLDRRAILQGGSAALLATTGLRTPPRRRAEFDPTIIDALHQARASMVTADSMLGPRQLARQAIEKIAILESLIPLAPHDERASLFELAAAFAEFTGWLFDDAGDTTAGSLWSDRALEFAYGSNNDVLVAYILMRKSQQATLVGDAAKALSFAGAASRQARPDSLVLASALQQQAHGHALEGDESGTLRAMESAFDALDAQETTPDRLHLAEHCSPEYLHAQIGACMLELGNARKAVTAFDQALATWPTTYRREEGLHLARKAAALTQAREPDHAVTVAHEAATVASETGSARALDVLRSVEANLKQIGPTTPELKQLSATLKPQPAN